MNKTKAIACYCLECSGGSTDERIGCVLFDCPLWEYRLGVQAGKLWYRERIKKFFKSGRVVSGELLASGFTEEDFQRARIKESRQLGNLKALEDYRKRKNTGEK